jgi:hypothetical protein
MTARARAALANLLHWLVQHPEARLAAAGDGQYRIASNGADTTPKSRIGEETVRFLRSNGLLREAEPGRYAAASVAAAWLKRQANPAMPFRSQHGELGTMRLGGNEGDNVLVNMDESPVGALARPRGKGAKPWLGAEAVSAAERLRRDFEVGQLQPRITANWSASVKGGRRAGGSAGLTDLTDMALAARIRFDAAMHAVGPELSGLLVDICCLLKGLETVERERQWPARSAKLVLRIALESLARHYGLDASATGKAGSGRVRHWGADDYRPEMT